MSEKDSTGLIIVAIVAVVAITGIVLMVLNAGSTPSAVMLPADQLVELADSEANVAGQVGKAFVGDAIPLGMKDKDLTWKDTLRESTFTKKDAKTKVKAALYREGNDLILKRIDLDANDLEFATKMTIVKGYRDVNNLEIKYDASKDSIVIKDSEMNKELAALVL
jgi:hypothetical protein